MASVTCKEIERYIRTSYGYGNVNADYWLIGIEQHCNRKNIMRQISKRISKWGSKPFQDLKAYHQSIGETRYFTGKKPELSRTWSKLICFLIGLEGRPYPEEREVIREFQKQQLGTRHRENCLLELLPLPCPSTKRAKWPSLYEEWGKQYPRLSFLKKRTTYYDKVLSDRIDKIQNLLNRQPTDSPRVVLFYGKKFEEDGHGRKIAGTPLTETWRKAKYGKQGKTWFVLTNHVSARNGKGLTKRECYELGVFLRKKIESDAKDKTEE